MPSITPFDLELLQHAKMKMQIQEVKVGDDGKMSFNQKGMYNLIFQYPPVVPSDNKGGEWKEIQTRAAEPIPFYMGGTPRQLELKFSYIINNESWGTPSGTQTWNAETISSIVKNLRGYFYNTAGTELLIHIDELYNIGGTKSMTWRADNVNISHSDAIVAGSAKSGAKMFYPLRTDVSMTLKLYITMRKIDEKTGDPVKDQSGNTVNVPKLSDMPSPEWY